MAKRAPGEWIYVPYNAEQQKELDREHVRAMLSQPGMDFPARCKALDQYYDYFPEDLDNLLPEEGGWVLVIKPPPTEYTVPPFSFWFAEPWPMRGEGPMPKRVKIITPKGELGLFPREYRFIENPNEYYEFIGREIAIHLFGGDLTGAPLNQLFYMQSRGIAKEDALAMLLKDIKGHGILWLECGREIANYFLR